MNGRFYLDPRGTLMGETPDAQKALGSAAQGRYTWMATSRDLLLFIRTPTEGHPAESPRVVLAGDASGFPISDLIAFLCQSRWSGVVRVDAPSGERSIFLKDGEVRGATSDDPADRLGEIIVRLGYVTRPQLEQVMADQPPSRVGRALVERGVIQAHDLWKCISHQVSEIFHALVLAREGAFALIDQPIDEKAQSTVRISGQSLLMDSIRKIDEMAHFRKRIPHGRMFVAAKRGPDSDLEAEEKQVLALVDGQRTVLEIAQAAKLSEFDATKVIFRLLEGGYVGVSPTPGGSLPTPAPAPIASEAVAPAAPATPARAPDEARLARVFNFIFKEIYAEVDKAKMGAEFLTSANAALIGEGLSHAPVLRGLSFTADGALPEDRVLKAYEGQKPMLGPDPLAGLRRALSDVMFFLLFQAGELLESGADEDLNRRVKVLLATLEPT